MTRPIRRRALFVASGLVGGAMLAGCAGPPLTQFTLWTPPPAAPPAAPGGRTMVIEVRRFSLPDFLDNQDLSLRNGNRLERSLTGRWASRLSVLATGYVVARLNQARPDALITDRPQAETPSYRLYVTISTLDLVAPGSAVLEADWLLMPRDPRLPPLRQRGRFTATGPMDTDQHVVDLTQAVLARLADAIAATLPQA